MSQLPPRTEARAMLKAIISHGQSLLRSAKEVRRSYRRAAFVLATIATEESIKGILVWMYAADLVSEKELQTLYRDIGQHRARQQLANAWKAILKEALPDVQSKRRRTHYPAMRATATVVQRFVESRARRDVQIPELRDWEPLKQRALYVDWYDGEGIPAEPVSSADVDEVMNLAHVYLSLLATISGRQEFRRITRHAKEFRTLVEPLATDCGPHMAARPEEQIIH